MFNAALASGDFKLDTARLDEFVMGARHTIRAASMLAADAATIPAGNLTALNATSSALNSFGEAMINLNAVPLNVPNIGAMGGGGGNNSSVTFAPGSIVIQAAAGMNVEQVANLVVTKIQSSTRGYR
jgi:hypothetical protein